MATLKYQTKIKLFNSYFDKNNNLSPKAILNIFQDVASHHAEEIGLGFNAMFQKNLYWILSRVKYDVIKMPLPYQTITVESWPHEKGRIDFDRDFKITDENGEILIIGTSKWCVIDTNSRTLCRTDNVDYDGEICPDQNYLEKFGKIQLPDIEFKQKFEYQVNFSDLDQNNHMNNTYYANLVHNAVANKNFTHFEINYLSECLQDDKIIVSSAESLDGEYIKATNGDKIAFIAHTKKTSN